MADVACVALLVIFFALAVAFVHACERIIGPDLEAEETVDEASPDRAAA